MHLPTRVLYCIFKKLLGYLSHGNFAIPFPRLLLFVRFRALSSSFPCPLISLVLKNLCRNVYCRLWIIAESSASCS